MTRPRYLLYNSWSLILTLFFLLISSCNVFLLIPVNNYNTGHNIMELCNTLALARFVTIKKYLISSKTNLVYELDHNLPSDLILSILEISEKCRKLGNTRKMSNLGEDTHSQLSLQKSKFSNNSQKVRESRYQIFFVLSNFSAFFYSAPNILSEILRITSLHEKSVC